MGEAMLYYMLGSDPALWPAGERFWRELITYDKGYYHSYKKGLRAKLRNATVTGFEVVPGGGDDHVDLVRPR